MQFKRFASAVALAGMLAAGSAAGAYAVNYPPTQVLPKEPAVPPKVVTPEANRPGVKSAAPRTGTPAETGDQLAYTGSDALIGAAAGALLILGGAGAVVASRRRSTN